MSGLPVGVGVFVQMLKSYSYLLHYSSSSYNRIWDVECGSCLRLLEGHEELVR